MKTARTTRMAFAGIIALAASLTGDLRQAHAQAEDPSMVPGSKPDIIMVMADDLRYDDLRVMPRTRELLGEQGTTFSTSLVSSPLCAPSRTGFFTGAMTHNHELGAGGSFVDVDLANSLPTWLRESGYYTSHVGKHINGYGLTTPLARTGSGDQWTGPTYVPPGYDDWFALVDPSTNAYFDFLANNNGHLEHFPGPDHYKSDVLTEHAVRVIETQRDNPQPLFLTLAPNTPHDEAVWPLQQEPLTEGIMTRDHPDPAPRHRGLFADEPLPAPPSFDEADASSKPAEVRDRPRLSVEEIQTTTANNRARLAALQALDENIATIYDALHRTDRLDDTVFVFTADNGWTLGEHRYSRTKTVHYEPSSRVPLLVRGPGFPAGTTREQPVYNLDLTATFVDLAAAVPTRPLDGWSLLPFAADASYGSQRVLGFELDTGRPAGANAPIRSLLGGDSSEPSTHYSAVRTRSWKYVLHTDTGEEELYHLAEDPDELHNLALDAAYVREKNALKREQDAMTTCVGITCRRIVELP
ncbi:sulfatase family protein [Nocardia pneumoniae]|uniref:sulfatase family protein n=1 Tax=Nocardia pneumoniae TaxID=228601 RepID=UPI0005949EFF|nr:sulfatase [Nocardia pneumoniae]